MEFLGDVVAWFASTDAWSGPNGIPTRLVEHLWISALSLVGGILVALPLGLAIGHTGRGAILVVSIANVGRAVPSLGLLGLAFLAFLPLGLGLSAWPGVIALAALAIPPIVTNTYVGVDGVDDELVDAARGMGMRELQVLSRVEIPVALPVILAGVRTSAVQVVATATLVAVIGGGTLGQLILVGINLGDEVRIFGGAILVAMLSVATELGFAAVQRAATSPGLREPDWGPTEPGGTGSAVVDLTP